MEIMQNWVLIVCVLAFTLCVVGGLLILFERWTPSNPHTAKFLVTGVVASAVAAVTPGAGNLFAAEKPPVAPGPLNGGNYDGIGNGGAGGGDITAPLEAEPTSTPSPTPAATPTPTPSPSPTPTPPAAEAEPQFSAEVRKWAETTLPPRPFLDKPLGSAYPPCAARLRAAGEPDGPSSEADTCFNQLQAYNSQVLIPHRDRRAKYIPQLQQRSRDERNEERWRYLTAEHASFTFGDDAQGFERVSAVFKCDEHLMINLRKYGLLKEAEDCPRSLSEAG
ncbi:hypothetical protein INR77_02035 [Erythrobacter sp. SCSIO 43205]|uniref:hypothetical protein n=1 Tax=Erythrobacter sp. SCSIO 43205 TaxID=2779361 RepID=UPI001CA8A991|nr:hypothetical protein [Erythrobacter sp. SCSIO 43205]UAB78539.1 hypothetical protein INR77_02035 [Erythrobacter sp. SCSIO 43205]